jgi:hypothetical protein
MGKKSKRTFGIWIIFIGYLVWSALALPTLYFVYSGKIQLPPAQQAYVNSYSSIDIALSMLVHGAELFGAISLFMLRRIAFHFFTTAFGIGIIIAFWHSVAKGWLAAHDSWPLIVFQFILYIIGSTVCVYCWVLTRRGILK